MLEYGMQPSVIDLYTFTKHAKKLNFYKSLVIIHDKFNNKVELIKNNGEIFIE